MKKFALPMLGIVAALSFGAVPASANEIDVAVDVKEPAVDVALEDPVEITRAGDDGIIADNERNLDGLNPVDNPDVIFYTMGAGFDPVDTIAETAAEQAAQQVADRVEEKAAEAPAPVAPAADLH